LRNHLMLVVAVCMLAAVSVAGVALAAGTRTTTLQDDYFTKPKLTISAGTTVVWKWNTGEQHTVTDVKKRFGSKKTTRATYKHQFARKGTFTVFCKVHPQVMRQRIVVK
jgi:plastocyanin